MAMYINTNIVSLNAQANLANSQSTLATDIQRLSSGLRINSAADDAAGMAIATRMGSQIAGQNQAVRNANDGISLAQTAQGAMQSIVANLQTMRDLAVQSANATYSASDRASMNAEVQQLKAEIDRVAGSTTFNGVNLLDGTFTAQNFQVGANNTVNDSIQVASIANMHTSQLGSAGSSYAANVTGSATTTALNAGDLTLNGYQVGASQLGTAPGQTAASAYSIAQAINAISANSGVTATANTTAVAGSAPTAEAAIAAGTFSINGVSVGAVASGGTSAAGQGANLAAAINLVSSQTGVTAVANATTGAVKLTAADGRDVQITMNVAGGETTSSPTATAAAAAQLTTFLADTGLSSSNVATAGTTTVASGTVAGGTVTGTTTTAAVFTVTVDGKTLDTATVAAGSTSTGAITGSALDSAWAAFNTANPGYTLSGSFAAGTAQITKADGTSVTIASTVTGGAGGTTVAVSFAGTGFLGTAAAGSFGGTAGSNAVTNHGTVSLSSTSSTGIVVGGANVAYAGLSSGTTAATVASTINSISSMDVSTASDASNAIATIDGAINTVNSAMGQMGAVQNRFQSVVTNLQTSVQNLTAAQSRIQDTDFAATTASLTQAQILQQAGTAMLAQANAMPNAVLTLLK